MATTPIVGSSTLSSSLNRSSHGVTEPVLFNATQLNTTQPLLSTKNAVTVDASSTALVCEGEWSVWTDCAAVCGKGQRRRSFVITTTAQNMGVRCTLRNHVADEVSPCFVDCALELTVMDGLLYGAFCFKDCNCNGCFDSDEPSATTNEHGVCALNLCEEVPGGCTPAWYGTTQSGTIDQQSGSVVSELLFSAVCSTDSSCTTGIISPLTTLMHRASLSSPQVLALFNLSSTVNIATFNPFDSSGSERSREALRVKLANNQMTVVLAGFTSAAHSIGMNLDEATQATAVAIGKVAEQALVNTSVLGLSDLSNLFAVASHLSALASATESVWIGAVNVSLLMNTTAVAIANVNLVIQDAALSEDLATDVAGPLSNVGVLQHQVALGGATIADGLSILDQVITFTNFVDVQNSATNMPPSTVLLPTLSVVLDRSRVAAGQTVDVGPIQCVDFDDEDSCSFSLHGQDSTHFRIRSRDDVLQYVLDRSQMEPTLMMEYEITIVARDSGLKSFAETFVLTVIDSSGSTTSTGNPNTLNDMLAPSDNGFSLGAMVGIIVASCTFVLMTILLAVCFQKKWKKQQKDPTGLDEGNKEALLRDPTYTETPDEDYQGQLATVRSDEQPERNLNRHANPVGIGEGIPTVALQPVCNTLSDEEETARLSEAWQLSRSVRFLTQSLNTEPGQKTLRNVADLYYNGDTERARAYLMYKLQNEVRTIHEEGRPFDSTTDLELEEMPPDSDQSMVYVPEASLETTQFVNELLQVVEEVDKQRLQGSTRMDTI